MTIPSFAETTFLSYTETVWVALGVIASLGIALAGFFWSQITGWLSKPVLRLSYSVYLDYSGTVERNWWLRIPVTNKGGRQPATNVEVFLNNVFKLEEDQSLSPVPNFVPMRLNWSNTQKPSCERIPEDTYRLIDLGCHTPGNTIPQARVGNGVTYDLDTLPKFHFATETLSKAPCYLTHGRYQLHLTLSSDNSASKQIVLRLIFPATVPTDGSPLNLKAASAAQIDR